jgi:hypothetical protein
MMMLGPAHTEMVEACSVLPIRPVAREVTMHFIEDLFGIAPDGGSGVLELCLFVAPIIMTGLVVWWRHESRKIVAGTAGRWPY